MSANGNDQKHDKQRGRDYEDTGADGAGCRGNDACEPWQDGTAEARGSQYPSRLRGVARERKELRQQKRKDGCQASTEQEYRCISQSERGRKGKYRSSDERDADANTKKDDGTHAQKQQRGEAARGKESNPVNRSRGNGEDDALVRCTQSVRGKPC